MSIFTDFFIATTEDVNALRRGQFLRDLFPTLEMNYVDSSKVNILAKLIVRNSQEHMPNEKQSHFLVLVKGASGEKFLSADKCNEEDLMRFDLWIERCDPIFAECLATFPAEQVLPVATQWAIQWAEFDGEPVNKDATKSLSEVIQQLCQLAKRALAEGKQLYLQTCL
jgi:hypothetical protein